MAGQNSGREQPSSALIQPCVRSYFYPEDSEEESQLGIQKQRAQHISRSSRPPYNSNHFPLIENRPPHSPSSQSTHLAEDENFYSNHINPRGQKQTHFQESEHSIHDEDLHSSSDSEESFVGAYTHTKVWTSFRQQQMDRWRTIQPRLMRMYPIERDPRKVCPFIPRDHSQYLEHITEMNIAEQTALARKMQQFEIEKSMGFPELHGVKAFAGKKFGSMEDGEDRPPEVDDFRKTVEFRYSRNPPTRGYVLAERTIWCPAPSVPWRQQPAWPCKSEMDWEGDQRVATENGRFGRYPPLPRVDPNNDSVAWHLKPRLRSYPFDEPWLVPTMEDVYAPVDQIEDPEIIAMLLNSDLFPEIDDPPIPVRDPNAHLSGFASAGAERRLS
ncbi:hypothetical protein FKW77_006522 [Venturia effusa]|uniref:Uncharacterized protein n=1 Tax=Venturia effusa TaxID=50376 RepID=A0A517LDX1_9PEZI|nr:hypothetical protein FKW77_006522 [Venturia effusa]